MSVKSGHIAELDGIRGIACLSILLAHCVLGPMDMKVYTGEFEGFIRNYSVRLLLGGVDLFFVLSGFLIGGILIDNRKAENFFHAFWTRRIVRIFPVYFLLIGSYALAMTVHRAFPDTFLKLWLLEAPHPPMMSLVTFMQNYFSLSGYGGPRWIGITWSVSIEEQFYMLFPIIVYVLSRKALIALALVGAIIVTPLMRVLIEWYFGNWYAAYLFPLCRMDGLLAGVLVAILVRSPTSLDRVRPYRWVLDIPLLLGLYHHAAGLSPRQSVAAFTFALLILRIFLIEDNSPFRAVLRNGVLGWFGMISYGLYMYHQSINGLVHGILFGQAPTIRSIEHWLAAGIAMVLAILLAWLSFKHIETPIRKSGQRVTYRYAQEGSGKPAT